MKDKMKVLEKLFQIGKHCKVLLKTGRNENYDYVEESAVKAEIKPLLESYNVLFLPTALVEVSKPEDRVKSCVIDYMFVDLDSGEFVKGSVSGAGWDEQDKGLYIAFTGAIKNMFMHTFNMSSGSGSDPEKRTQPSLPKDTRKKQQTMEEKASDQERRVKNSVENIEAEKERLDRQVENLKNKREEIPTTIASGEYSYRMENLEKMKQPLLCDILQNTFQVNIDDYVEGRKTQNRLSKLIIDCQNHGVDNGIINYPSSDSEESVSCTEEEMSPTDIADDEIAEEIPDSLKRNSRDVQNIESMFSDFDQELIQVKVDEMFSNKFFSLDDFYERATSEEVQQAFRTLKYPK